MSRRTIVVIGAGAAGTLTASHLLRLGWGRTDLEVRLIDPRPDTGRGVAYSTTDLRHLLNVPAGNMSADPHDPEHFLQWLRATHNPLAASGDFVPRQWYGEYLDSVLADSARTSPVGFRRLHDDVVDLRRRGEGYDVHRAHGPTIHADHVVLALGSPPPDGGWVPPSLRRCQSYFPDPWQSGVLSEIGDRYRRVLLVGSGLTMVDLALALDRPGATTWALSRSGLLPKAHANRPTRAIPTPPLPSGTLGLGKLQLLVTDQMDRTRSEQGDWRPGFDSLRPVTDALWQRMTPADQRIFLASWVRRWDVRRHRMAPKVGSQIDRLQANASLKHVRAAVKDAAETEDGIVVSLSDRTALVVDAVVDCTGTGSLTERNGAAFPLVDRLIDAGLVRPHHLDLGVDVDDQGHAIERDGAARRDLHIVGPLRRGVLWETTAIPEIRVQASDTAAGILAATGSSQPERTLAGAAH